MSVRWLCVEKMLCFCFCSFCLYRNYMNDTLRTNVFVRFQAETIACACIFLAARALQVRGPLFHPPMNAYYVDASTSAHSTSAASNVWTFCAFFSPDTSAIPTSLVPAVWSHWWWGQGDLCDHSQTLHQEEGRFWMGFSQFCIVRFYSVEIQWHISLVKDSLGTAYHRKPLMRRVPECCQCIVTVFVFFPSPAELWSLGEGSGEEEGFLGRG